jgi:dUTP pyrophosphatase
MQLKFKPLGSGAILPTRAKVGDAGYDLTATSCTPHDDGEMITYGTNLAVQIPEGHVGLLFPRSSIIKTGLGLTNSVGVIDSGYRGEIKVVMRIVTQDDEFNMYMPGDRVAQLVVVPVLIPEAIFVDELPESDRGAGGFGSTNT